MKSLLLAILLRLSMGVALTFIGWIVSIVAGNPTIFTNGVSMVGLVIMALAGIPFLRPMDSRGVGPGGFRGNINMFRGNSKGFAEDVENQKSQMTSWAITLLLVGLPPFLLPMIPYFLN